MGPVTILFGVIFILIGSVGFLLSDPRALTALIPGGFGAAFVLLGFLAGNDKLRKHVMHLAALLGVVAFIGGAVMAIITASRDGVAEEALKFTSQASMALAAAVFVGLCVKSFVDARRARRQTEAGTTSDK